jgi:GxxExxY protein
MLSDVPGHAVRICRGMTQTLSSEAINRITSTICQSATRIHRTVGPGILEKAYFGCLCYELVSAGLTLETEKELPLLYQGVKIDCAYRADLIVNRNVIVEVKAIESFAPIHSRQLLTYLRIADLPVGLLLNFGAPTMKQGIKRVVRSLRFRVLSIPLSSRLYRGSARHQFRRAMQRLLRQAS